MYKYDTLNSTFANQTRYWRTVPNKINILLDNSFFRERQKFFCDQLANFGR